MSKKKVLRIHLIFIGIIVAIVVAMVIIRTLFLDMDIWIIEKTSRRLDTPTLDTVEWIYALCIIVGCLLLLFVVIFSVLYNYKVVKYEDGIKTKYKEINIISKAIANLNPEFLKRVNLTFKHIHEREEEYDSKEMWDLISELLKHKETIIHDRMEMNTSCSIIMRPEECNVDQDKDEIFVLRRRFSETYNSVYKDVLGFMNRMEEFFCRYDHIQKCKKILLKKQEVGNEQKEIDELEKFIEMEEKELQTYFVESRQAKVEWKKICDDKMEQLNDYAFMYNYEREKKIHEIVHRSMEKKKK